ncbi:hypothetical protein ACQBAT_12930 [Ornithinimicrobium sp. Y1847]|uniref:hypothetical protein n=1 Tax=Ornithinimicrobium sp. Y1847 TaxID=3405419 RepID=UPI003B685035
MTATDLERKVRQLDNDVSAIYTMIFDVQGTQKRHTNRFDELQSDIVALGQRAAGLEGRMEGLEVKLDQVLELLRR